MAIEDHKPRRYYARAPKHRRPSPDEGFYRRAAWRKFRRWFLDRHPLCVRCESKGITREAVDVHHVRRRLDDPEGHYDPENCEGLCKACHSLETLRETRERRSDG